MLHQAAIVFEISNQGQGMSIWDLAQLFWWALQLSGLGRIQCTTHWTLFPPNETNEREVGFFTHFFLPLVTVGHMSVFKTTCKQILIRIMRYALCTVGLSCVYCRICTAYLCAFVVSFHGVIALDYLSVWWTDGKNQTSSTVRPWLLLELQQTVNKYFKFNTNL